MYLRPGERVSQIEVVALVRCTGNLEDGQKCPVIMEVALHEKAVCPYCGQILPAYADYARARSIEKTYPSDACDLVAGRRLPTAGPLSPGEAS